MVRRGRAAAGVISGGDGPLSSSSRRRSQPSRLVIAILTMLLATVFAAACTGSDAGDPVVDEQVQADTTARRARSELRPAIRLGVADWTGARLNAAIAEELIERRLGYPVEQEGLIDIDQMIVDLESGSLQAVLEMWPSTLDGAETAAIADGRITSLGDLGVIGKAGWFVPRYVVQQTPELATWEGLADPTIAGDFATDETAPLGRFLGTDPAYVQADEELIEALDLPFEVIYSGSDAATADEVERAIATEAPVLLYWWLPTAEVTRYDLVPVALPTRTADCEAAEAAGELQRCDYAEDRLVKLGSPALDDDAPDVARFLRAFSLTTIDQQQMIDRVDNGGSTVESVASAWIDANQSRWETWFE